MKYWLKVLAVITVLSCASHFFFYWLFDNKALAFAFNFALMLYVGWNLNKWLRVWDEYTRFRDYGFNRITSLRCAWWVK